MNDNSSLTERFKVVEFKPEANQDTVAALEDLLKDAKEGKIVGFAFVGQTHDNTTLTLSTGETIFHLIVTGLETIKWRMMNTHYKNKI